MFICQKCGRVTKPHEKAASLVVKKRPKKYPNGGVGWEIVKEIKVCGDCNDGS